MIADLKDELKDAKAEIEKLEAELADAIAHQKAAQEDIERIEAAIAGVEKHIW